MPEYVIQSTETDDHEGPSSNGLDYRALNALLNLYGPDGEIQIDKDREAVREYISQHVQPNTVTFGSLTEKIDYLTSNGYYRKSVLERYDPSFVTALFERAYAEKFMFENFLGAVKFYSTYALRTFDGKRYLEGLEDRLCMVALTLADGDEDLAANLLEEMLSGRFQFTTATLLNSGKEQGGESISCFLVRVEDSMESVARAVNAGLQLSKRSGGVAFMLSNIRESGAPVNQLENQAGGVIPIMKLLEDSFSFAHHAGTHQGAGAGYLHAHHPDILKFLDTKRENADEKIRIKSLSLGVVIPDVTFELAKRNEDMCLFSPYDIQRFYGVPFSEIDITEKYDELMSDERIAKTLIRAREFFQLLAERQFESGYPYVLFEGNANRANPIDGRITHSNLCSEILQVSTASVFNEDLTYAHVGKDISCNLGSLNIARIMDSPDFGRTVEVAVRGLTAVSDQARLDAVPSVARGNNEAHAIGLGQMNLHGYLAREHIRYGSAEALDFTNIYFLTVTFHAIRASNSLARERGKHFEGFLNSKYASGEYFDKYVDREWAPATRRVAELFEHSGVRIPTRDDWRLLKDSVMRYGIYNQNLQAVAPNGSISYINNSTASIHPVPAKIEIRKERKIGRVYYPAPYISESTVDFYEDAYEIGYEKLIDTYAVAGQHVDQGLSLTLFFKDTATTRDINRAQIYAWQKGIKTLYYIRIRQSLVAGTEMEGCVSCTA